MSNFSRRKFAASVVLGWGGTAIGMDIDNYRRLGLHRAFIDQAGVFDSEVNGHKMGEVSNYLNVAEDQQYNPCSEAYPNATVPEGEIVTFSAWNDSKLFAGSMRDFWLYIPKQKQARQELPLMVYQDGATYLDPLGSVRVTKVLDSLIHAGDLLPTAALFVNPGVIKKEDWIQQRSIEYDTVDDRYVRFLVHELIPYVESEMGVKFSPNPADRMICGISSGGICAFNAAWHKPEAFGRVLSHCGSFVNLRGGHNYPYLIKSTPRKEIKVFLQSGTKDLNSIVGNWPLANKLMADAFSFSGYQSKFVFGEGGHSLRHGGAIFADSLRWLTS